MNHHRYSTEPGWGWNLAAGLLLVVVVVAAATVALRFAPT